MGKQKGNAPINNQRQNEQARKKYGIKNREKIHDILSGEGYGYQEAFEEVEAFWRVM